MTTTSEQIDSKECIEAASSEETASVPPPFPYRSRSTAAEEAAEVSATITRKASTPPPVSLRPVLGRCLVQTPCGRLKNHLTGLAQLIDAPPPKTKGTPPAAAPAKSLPAPKYCLKKRREALHLPPTEVWEILIKTLLPSMQEAIESLSYQLVKKVEDENVLPGYSAVAVVAGCMQFAACALETEIQFSKKRLLNEGFKVNPQAIRCAYNTLLWERSRFEAVLEEQGTTLEALKLPIAPDGSVSSRILREDTRRKWAEMEMQGGRDESGEESYSST